jgi:hypothetical protein
LWMWIGEIKPDLRIQLVRIPLVLLPLVPENFLADTLLPLGDVDQGREAGAYPDLQLIMYDRRTSPSHPGSSRSGYGGNPKSDIRSRG